MIWRLAVTSLLLLACSKKDGGDRASGAGATPGGSPTAADRAGGTTTATGGAKHDQRIEGGSADPTGAAGSGSGVLPLHVKGGGDGVGVVQGSRRTLEPTIRVGQPTVDGALDKETVRRYIRRNLAALVACYQQRLVTRAGMTGTVTTTFVIQADGSVRDAKATGLDPEVEGCFAKVIETIQFPAPKERADVRVSYPFILHPTNE